ncbi:hypothetical protein DL96DRAFT_1821702 [Flagelloscypha sp. PMI_526]|nr:hypothetical protein DL96DRAFT_1821702 [Flagelloscypha sp. PMI_526]
MNSPPAIETPVTKKMSWFFKLNKRHSSLQVDTNGDESEHQSAVVFHPGEASSSLERLPRELLLNILLLSIDFPLTTSFSFRSCPLNLTHVSCGLRSLAVSLPELWSSIHIDVSKPCPKTEDLVQWWCQHLGEGENAPALALMFSYNESRPHHTIIGSQIKQWAPYVAPIMTNIARCRSIVITVGVYQFFHSLKVGDLPNLEVVKYLDPAFNPEPDNTWGNADTHTSPAFNTFWKAVEPASKLRKVTVSRFPLTKPSWSHLTHLHLCSPWQMDTTESVLRKSSETLNTLALETDNRFTGFKAVVTLPHLTNLKVFVSPNSKISKALSFLNLPALRNLYIHATRTFHLHPFGDLAERSGCRLTTITLDLTSDPISLDDLGLLTSMPRTFEHIHLKGVFIPQGTWESFVDATSNPFPALRTLDIGVLEMGKEQLPIINKVLESWSSLVEVRLFVHEVDPVAAFYKTPPRPLKYWWQDFEQYRSSRGTMQVYVRRLVSPR